MVMSQPQFAQAPQQYPHRADRDERIFESSDAAGVLSMAPVADVLPTYPQERAATASLFGHIGRVGNELMRFAEQARTQLSAAVGAGRDRARSSGRVGDRGTVGMHLTAVDEETSEDSQAFELSMSELNAASDFYNQSTIASRIAAAPPSSNAFPSCVSFDGAAGSGFFVPSARWAASSPASNAQFATSGVSDPVHVASTMMPPAGCRFEYHDSCATSAVPQPAVGSNAVLPPPGSLRRAASLAGLPTGEIPSQSDLLTAVRGNERSEDQPGTIRRATSLPRGASEKHAYVSFGPGFCAATENRFAMPLDAGCGAMNHSLPPAQSRAILAQSQSAPDVRMNSFTPNCSDQVSNGVLAGRPCAPAQLVSSVAARALPVERWLTSSEETASFGCPTRTDADAPAPVRDLWLRQVQTNLSTPSLRPLVAGPGSGRPSTGIILQKPIRVYGEPSLYRDRHTFDGSGRHRCRGLSSTLNGEPSLRLRNNHDVLEQQYHGLLKPLMLNKRGRARLSFSDSASLPPCEPSSSSTDLVDHGYPPVQKHRVAGARKSRHRKHRPDIAGSHDEGVGLRGRLRRRDRCAQPNARYQIHMQNRPRSAPVSPHESYWTDEVERTETSVRDDNFKTLVDTVSTSVQTREVEHTETGVGDFFCHNADSSILVSTFSQTNEESVCRTSARRVSNSAQTDAMHANVVDGRYCVHDANAALLPTSAQTHDGIAYRALTDQVPSSAQLRDEMYTSGVGDPCSQCEALPALMPTGARAACHALAEGVSTSAHVHDGMQANCVRDPFSETLVFPTTMRTSGQTQNLGHASTEQMPTSLQAGDGLNSNVSGDSLHHNQGSATLVSASIEAYGGTGCQIAAEELVESSHVTGASALYCHNEDSSSLVPKCAQSDHGNADATKDTAFSNTYSMPLTRLKTWGMGGRLSLLCNEGPECNASNVASMPKPLAGTLASPSPEMGVSLSPSHDTATTLVDLMPLNHGHVQSEKKHTSDGAGSAKSNELFSRSAQNRCPRSPELLTFEDAGSSVASATEAHSGVLPLRLPCAPSAQRTNHSVAATASPQRSQAVNVPESPWTLKRGDESPTPSTTTSATKEGADCAPPTPPWQTKDNESDNPSLPSQEHVGVCLAEGLHHFGNGWLSDAHGDADAQPVAGIASAPVPKRRSSFRPRAKSSTSLSRARRKKSATLPTLPALPPPIPAGATLYEQYDNVAPPEVNPETDEYLDGNDANHATLGGNGDDSFMLNSMLSSALDKEDEIRQRRDNQLYWDAVAKHGRGPPHTRSSSLHYWAGHNEGNAQDPARDEAQPCSSLSLSTASQDQPQDACNIPPGTITWGLPPANMKTSRQPAVALAMVSEKPPPAPWLVGERMSATGGKYVWHVYAPPLENQNANPIEEDVQAEIAPRPQQLPKERVRAHRSKRLSRSGATAPHSGDDNTVFRRRRVSSALTHLVRGDDCAIDQHNVSQVPLCFAAKSQSSFEINGFSSESSEDQSPSIEGGQSVSGKTTPKQKTIDRLRKIFDHLDRFHNNSITKRDLISLCRNSSKIAVFFGLPVCIGEKWEAFEDYVFQDVDARGDSEISWPEFKTWYEKQFPEQRSSCGFLDLEEKNLPPPNAETPESQVINLSFTDISGSQHTFAFSRCPIGVEFAPPSFVDQRLKLEVAQVSDASPAEEFGISIGWVLTAIEEANVTTMDHEKVLALLDRQVEKLPGSLSNKAQSRGVSRAKAKAQAGFAAIRRSRDGVTARISQRSSQRGSQRESRFLKKGGGIVAQRASADSLAKSVSEEISPTSPATDEHLSTPQIDEIEEQSQISPTVETQQQTAGSSEPCVNSIKAANASHRKASGSKASTSSSSSSSSSSSLSSPSVLSSPDPPAESKEGSQKKQEIAAVGSPVVSAHEGCPPTQTKHAEARKTKGQDSSSDDGKSDSEEGSEEEEEEESEEEEEDEEVS